MKEFTNVVLLGLGLSLAALIYIAWIDLPLSNPPVLQGAMIRDYEHFLLINGRQRRYLVHCPNNYDGTKPLPVVLGFHGAMGNAEVFARQTRLNEVADREGFLVVYPDGSGPTARGLYWNSGRGGYAAKHQIDDVGFIRELLATLPRLYRIDTRRVYAAGISNGAMMCYRLAHELSDQIAAIGAVAGGDLVLDGPAPPRPVPVIHFHGARDPIAPMAGGAGRFEGVVHPNIAQMITRWARIDNCGDKPAEVINRSDYTCVRYLPKSGTTGAPVTYYMLPEGGHTWPGGVVLAPRLMGKPIASVDASKLVWDFVSRHSLK
jgi:polyhydroxybutyrate depolymerase